MAISCMYNNYECSGCGACREPRDCRAQFWEPGDLLTCGNCGGVINRSDLYYTIDSDRFCDDCVEVHHG